MKFILRDRADIFYTKSNHISQDTYEKILPRYAPEIKKCQKGLVAIGERLIVGLGPSAESFRFTELQALCDEMNKSPVRVIKYTTVKYADKHLKTKADGVFWF